MDTKGLQKEFINWCKSKNKLPKSEDETKQLFVAFMKEKHPEEYNKAVLNQKKQQQAQAQKALHGAKLNYFKSLKHQCAEDEEVVYYKKGGSVTCGCKKKEEGGEVKKNCGGSAIITNFKMRKGSAGMELAEKKTTKKQPEPQNNKQPQKAKIYWTDLDDRKLDSLVTRKEIQKKSLTEQGEKDLKNLREKFKKAANKDQYEVDASEQPSKKCGGKVKKHQEGSVIAKFKAYRKGGNLNGIPFYLEGTPKGGIEFQENLEPPTYGVFGELGRNLEQGSEQFGKIIGSPATLILLTGLGSGIAGMAGPTVRILKDVKTALGSKSGLRNAIRKISRNLNAKKGSPEFRWIKTSGDIKKGGAVDRSFNGMGKSTQRIVNNASHSEGSGYNAQQMLNNNPIYLLARSNPESLGWKPYHTPANNLAYTTSNRIFKRNRLIDQARDWRNWIFE